MAAGLLICRARPLLNLKIKRKPDSINNYTFDDFELVGYEPHPHIAPPVSI
ncbi:Thymidylate synthase [compost metagenome]